MRDQTLADVDDRLIETGQFLEDVAKHPKKKACLESFVRSQNIVEWLRRTTKGQFHSYIHVVFCAQYDHIMLCLMVMPELEKQLPSQLSTIE